MPEIHKTSSKLLGTTVWKLRKFALTYFRQKFRDSNGFTKLVDFTEYFSESEFLVFTHTAHLLCLNV